MASGFSRLAAAMGEMMAVAGLWEGSTPSMNLGEIWQLYYCIVSFASHNHAFFTTNHRQGLKVAGGVFLRSRRHVSRILYRC